MSNTQLKYCDSLWKSFLILVPGIFTFSCMPENLPTAEKGPVTNLPPTVKKADADALPDYGVSGAFLLVEKGNSKTYKDLDSHTLHLVIDGKSKNKIEGIVSGRAEKQNYKTKSNPGKSGSLEPIPEGVYDVGKPVRDGKSAIGPWYTPILPDPIPRGDFGLHLDNDRSTAPGTAGCLGFPDKESQETFIEWMNGSSVPKKLVVDWKLGTLGKQNLVGLAVNLLSSFKGSESEDSEATKLEVKTDPVTGEIFN